MQTKPDGESSRVPTDFWAGLGFSKSMPDAAIRDRLKLANVRYNGPRMTTTYEVRDGDQGRGSGGQGVRGQQGNQPPWCTLVSHA